MNLSEICERYLDNADLCMVINNFPKVVLDITVQGKVDGKFWKVNIECDQVVFMELEADDDVAQNELFMVLDTEIFETTKSKVTPAVQHRFDSLADDDPVWSIKIFGGISILLVTTKLNWKLVELSQKEYEAIYA